MRTTRPIVAIAVTIFLLGALRTGPALAQSASPPITIGAVHRLALGVALQADLVVTCPTGMSDLLNIRAAQNVGNGRIQTAVVETLPICDGTPHPLPVFFTAADGTTTQFTYPPWGTAPVLIRVLHEGLGTPTYGSRTPKNTVLKDVRFGVARVAAGGLGLTVPVSLSCKAAIGIRAQVLQRVSANLVEVAQTTRQQTCKKSGSHTYRLSFVPPGPKPWSGNPLLVTLNAGTCGKAGECVEIRPAVATLTPEAAS